MSLFTIVLTVLGLCLFETVSSIDNAIINAEVLSGMGKAARRWFVTWGIVIAVFLVRGLLPWLIVWASVPQLGFIGSLTAAFSSDPMVKEAIEGAKPFLLMAGGVFLLLLFLHWLFLEPKNFGLPGERFFQKQGLWFYAVASVLLAGIAWYSTSESSPGNGRLAFAATLGATVFFLTGGLKDNAEHKEAGLMEASLSDIAKLLYLEVIDLSFSVDSVLGAFAFTLSVPLILLGNGLGALVVREITVGNIQRIKKYRFLKNGAMYSILALGLAMTLEAFGVELPEWCSPAATFLIVGAFFLKSLADAKSSSSVSS